MQIIKNICKDGERIVSDARLWICFSYKKMQKVTDKNKRRTIDKKQSHKNYIAIKLNDT